MGALIRALDWSKTRQIVLFWGPDFVALYNDAYAPTIGGKHPKARTWSARAGELGGAVGRS
jgi:hypothetical protein